MKRIPFRRAQKQINSAYRVSPENRRLSPSMHIFTSRDETLGMASLLAAVALFSTVEIASKFIGPQLDPLTLTFIRFFLTGIALLILSIPALRLQIGSHAVDEKPRRKNQRNRTFNLNGLSKKEEQP